MALLRASSPGTLDDSTIGFALEACAARWINNARGVCPEAAMCFLLRCSKQLLGYHAHADDELSRRVAQAKLPPRSAKAQGAESESPSRNLAQQTPPPAAGDLASVTPTADADTDAEDVPSGGPDFEQLERTSDAREAPPEFGLDRGAHASRAAC